MRDGELFDDYVPALDRDSVLTRPRRPLGHDLTDLLADIQANFEELDAQLAEYEDGEGGYVSYEELTEEDKTAMTATLAELSENLSLMAGALGLQ